MSAHAALRDPKSRSPPVRCSACRRFPTACTRPRTSWANSAGICRCGRLSPAGRHAVAAAVASSSLPFPWRAIRAALDPSTLAAPARPSRLFSRPAPLPRRAGCPAAKWARPCLKFAPAAVSCRPAPRNRNWRRGRRLRRRPLNRLRRCTIRDIRQPRLFAARRARPALPRKPVRRTRFNSRALAARLW